MRFLPLAYPLVGAALVAGGVGWIYPPYGAVVLGLLILADYVHAGTRRKR